MFIKHKMPIIPAKLQQIRHQALHIGLFSCFMVIASAYHLFPFFFLQIQLKGIYEPKTILNN